MGAERELKYLTLWLDGRLVFLVREPEGCGVVRKFLRGFRRLFRKLILRKEVR
jgi:hypothetical protein